MEVRDCRQHISDRGARVRVPDAEVERYGLSPGLRGRPWRETLAASETRDNPIIMSDHLPYENQDSGISVEEAKPKLRRPPMFKVLLLNDDYTPMEFVVQILETFFAMSKEKAVQIMLHVHTRGVGVCGVYTREIAETKVMQVNDYSRSHQHPLMCTMEEA